MIKQTLLVLSSLLFLGSYASAESKVASLIKYVDSYPFNADPSKGIVTPLAKDPVYQGLIHQYLPAGLIAELETLTVSSPIQLIEDRYLLIKTCEPHNCIHDAGVFIDTEHQNILVFLRSGNIDDQANGMHCFSSNNWQLSEMSDTASKAFWKEMAFNYGIPEVAFRCYDKQHYKDYQAQPVVDFSNG